MESKKISPKKIWLIIIITFVVVSHALFLGLLLFEKDVSVRLADINLYINDSYNTISDDSRYERASGRSKAYFPQYTDFEYKEYISGFYLLDGRVFRVSADSFVLELKFDTLDKYKEFLKYEHERIAYTDKYHVSYNGYKCLVTTDENITLYFQDDKRPYSFGMLCQSEETLTVRYVYFSDPELGEVDRNFENVFEYTHCEW